MPEGIEIEIYRIGAEAVVGRTIERVEAPDAWFLKGGLTSTQVIEALTGQVIEGTRRRGKLLVLDLSNGVALGLRFGMTGRLIVDDEASIEYLEYSSKRDDPAWDRFILHFADGGDLRIRDPRRLGGVELDPAWSVLGPDVFTITVEELEDRVLVGKVALKTRLLDQKRISGIGNLIADETLWRAGLDPAREADSLQVTERRTLRDTLIEVVTELMAQGGSHTGDLMPARTAGGQCPQDGETLLRRTIGGRTTYSCPLHQR